MRVKIVCALLAALGTGQDEDWVEPLAAPAAEGARCPDWIEGAGGAAGATWLEPAPDGGSRLRLARFESARLGPAETVVEGAELLVNWADFPRAVEAGGGTLAAWLARRPKGGHAYDLMRAWRGAGRAEWSAPARLSSDDSDAEHGFVSLAPLGGTRVAALWLDGREVAAGGATGLYLATVDAGEVGAEALLDPRVCDCCQTALVRLGDGSLLAAWRDRGEGETRDIAFARGRADEADSWSAPRPVHEDGWVIAGCPVNGPALAAAHGRIAAAWFTLGSGNEPRVLVAEYDPEAGRFGAPLRIDEGDPEGRVHLAVLSGGRLVVSWMERAQGGAEWLLREVPRPAGEPRGELRGELRGARRIARVPLSRDSGFLRLAVREDELLAAWTEPDRARFARLDWSVPE